MGVVNNKGKLLDQGVIEIFTLFGKRDLVPGFVEHCYQTIDPKRFDDSCVSSYDLYKCYKIPVVPEIIDSKVHECIAEVNLSHQDVVKLRKRDFTDASQCLKVRRIFFVISTIIIVHILLYSALLNAYCKSWKLSTKMSWFKYLKPLT